jgi:hypothetical protein
MLLSLVVVPMSRFGRFAAEVVPEIGEAPPPPVLDPVARTAQAKPAVDLFGRPKICCLLLSNGGAKTTYARWKRWKKVPRR